MADGSRRRPPRLQGTRGGTGSRAVAKGGPRRTGPKSAFERALADVQRFIRAVDAPSAVIGGVALISWGRARNTTDIDVAIATAPEEAETLIQQARRFTIQPRIEEAGLFARESLVLLLQHAPTGIPVDVSFAQLDFERAALQAAVDRPFGAVTVRVPHPQALIVYKMVAARPKDIEDVQDLLLRGVEVDSAQVLETLAGFDALLQTDRAELFRSLWAQFRSARRGKAPRR
jgi:hypothetical protein